MSQPLNADQELVSDVVACQLVIKQILDVLDVIAPVEVREKMSSQLKNIDFTNHPAAADPVTMRAIQKPSRLLNSSLPHRVNPLKKPLLQTDEAAVSQNLYRRNALAPMMINAAGVTRHSEHVGRSAQGTYPQVSHCALHQEWFAATDHHAAVLFPDRAGN
ncbi:protein [Escherichia coli]|uniref:Protein n=5 Tax=Enterobacterales TaxID=91347 RepID=A0A376RHR8_ECOLX|nr:protein [Escherichia coli]